MLFRLLAALTLFAGLLPSGTADDLIVQRAYHVADLVIPIPDYDTSDRPKSSSGCVSNRPDAPQSGKTREADLIELIQTAVAPHTWADVGGCGTLAYSPLGMTLVARQTADVQEQIADLLQALHKLQERQVIFEVKFVQVAKSAFERIGIDFNEVNADSGQMLKPQVRREKDACQSLVQLARWQPQRALLLTDKQLLQFVEAIQADHRTNVMQAPKVTMFDGQKVALRIGETQFFVTDIKETKVNDQVVWLPVQTAEFIGTEMGLQGSVTPDGSHVCVHIRGSVSTLAANIPLVPVTVPVTPGSEPGCQGVPVPFTQYIQKPQIEKLAVEKTLAIPDGGTALIHCGKRTITGRKESGPPFLSKVPYINRLFKNVGFGDETCHLLMLVTTRFRTSDGEEQAEQAACVCNCPGPPAGKLIGSSAGVRGPGACRGATAENNCLESMVLTEQRVVGQHCSVADIVQMSQAGVSDDVIINQIRTTRACFTLGSTDIIKLVGQKVSDRVILEMQSTQQTQSHTTAEKAANVGPAKACSPASRVGP